MDRFFKIVREDGGIFDIVQSDNARLLALQTMVLVGERYNGFKFVECTRDEWWSWSVMNWREVDRMENDMVSMDTF